MKTAPPRGVTALDLLTLVPFVLPAVLSLTKATKCGRGVIVPVTVAANTNVNVAHNLGRLVQGGLCIFNGASFTAQIAFPTGGGTVRTTKQQTIQLSIAGAPALVFLF